MKNLIKTMCILVCLSFVSPIYAQESVQNPEDLDTEVRILDVDGLRLSLSQKVQNPGNKNIVFELKIYSEITSDRVQIRWDVDGVSRVMSGEEYEQIAVSSGDVIERQLVVRPTQYGVTRVRAIVEAFEIDGTRVATASQAFFTGSNGGLLTASNEQRIANTLYFVQQGAIILLIILLLIGGGVLGYQLFRKWLHSDN